MLKFYKSENIKFEKHAKININQYEMLVRVTEIYSNLETVGAGRVYIQNGWEARVCCIQRCSELL